MIFDDFQKITKFRIYKGNQSHLSDISKLYEGNEEYAKISNSWPISMENIQNDLSCLPPSMKNVKKNYCVIYDQHSCIGIIDYLEGYKYPSTTSKDTVWIGLFEISIENQSKGLGTKIMNQFIDACRMNDMICLQLGVIRSNIKALHFWKKMNFKEIGETNNGEFDLIIMELKIQ